MRITESKLRQTIRRVIKEFGNVPMHGYRGGDSPVRTGLQKNRKDDDWYISIVQDMSFEQAQEWLNSLDLPQTHILYFLKQHPDCPYEIKEG